MSHFVQSTSFFFHTSSTFNSEVSHPLPDISYPVYSSSLCSPFKPLQVCVRIHGPEQLDQSKSTHHLLTPSTHDYNMGRDHAPPSTDNDSSTIDDPGPSTKIAFGISDTNLLILFSHFSYLCLQFLFLKHIRKLFLILAGDCP